MSLKEICLLQGHCPCWLCNACSLQRTESFRHVFIKDNGTSGSDLISKQTLSSTINDAFKNLEIFGQYIGYVYNVYNGNIKVKKYVLSALL